ncbi:phosphatase 2C-like domain-containing protein [Aspergillus cavernicola]|uniref:Phosphatase 2C-like domain-containing protein n=1 Tax=Aspergillus cavernicola TaxID=176166 RepID=A0ABR4J371_9EURO
MVRPRLGRVPTISIVRTRAKTYSTKPSYSNWSKFAAVTAAFGTSGLVWLTTHGDVSDLDTPPAEDSVNELGPSKEQVTKIISQDAYSFSVHNVAGVDRYDGTQVASNSPCEDRFSHGTLPSPWKDGNQWMAWAVFDGHSGWQTADLLKRQLLPFVQRSLGDVQLPSNGGSIPEESIQRAIVQGFLDLDNSIMNTALEATRTKEPLLEKVKKCLPAFAGSCALLSLYNPVTSTLHVACTGDSRAVLGQQKSDGSWEATPLSVDQTGLNKEEITRLYNEHPGEDDIVKDGRVLGIMVSRAFGDSLWKWPLDIQQEMKQRFYGPSPLTPRYNIRTPPYLTARPAVTTAKIDPSRPSFLIMATDGMWDMLSNQQAVDLVGKWLKPQAAGQKHSDPEPSSEPFDFGHFWNGASWKFMDKRATTQDDNAAVHLVRNSLGGNHHELIAGRLAYSFPHSRRVRDDITVQVVFFSNPGLKKATT